jgi:putative ABC transport system permease protein
VTTLQDASYYEDKLDYIAVSVKDPLLAVDTAKRITDLLSQTHGLPADTYYAEAFSSIVEQVDAMLSIITAFVAFVAFISLFVGGVGVMNIMLVTVTERTREIGIRKSLGATNGNIKVLFLMEALILTTIGGGIGILLGHGLSSVICSVLSGMMGVAVTPSVDVVVVAAAFGVSSLVGVVFGVYPASKAAKLDPIDALRYE